MDINKPLLQKWALKFLVCDYATQQAIIESLTEAEFKHLKDVLREIEHLGLADNEFALAEIKQEDLSTVDKHHELMNKVLKHIKPLWGALVDDQNSLYYRVIQSKPDYFNTYKQQLKKLEDYQLPNRLAYYLNAYIHEKILK